MVNQFQIAPDVHLPRNLFERPSTYKTTLDSGKLYPIFFDEVLPGDTHRMNATFFGRMTTPFVPVMDNIYLDVQWFFIPLRLVWDNFKKFMGERKNPSDSIDYLTPIVQSGDSGFTRYGLFDYLSIPPAISNLWTLAFYARSYNLCWNEWYRDENLQESVTVKTDDGPDDESIYTILPRGKRGDYFTSALPQPQKGPGVELPLGSFAPISIQDVSGNVYSGKASPTSTDSYGWNLGTMNANITNGSTRTDSFTFIYNRIGGAPFGNQSEMNLFADLSGATAATINSLRQAIALQQFLERDMRGGTRYIELVLSHFGVVSPDARIQRPEFLGGSTTRINTTPIAQNSATADGSTPQGNLAAYATVASTGNGFTRSFTEHGVILGLASIRADLTYQQGIDRHFSRRTRYDYYWPTLAHLGEQEIKLKEIYAQGTTDDDTIFGYQERYSEYRYKNSYITGKFRSSDPQSLDVWHLSQYFENAPRLNSEFIEEKPPIKRVLAVQDEPEFMLDCYFDLESFRELPVYGSPGLERI